MQTGWAEGRTQRRANGNGWGCYTGMSETERTLSAAERMSRAGTAMGGVGTPPRVDFFSVFETCFFSEKNYFFSGRRKNRLASQLSISRQYSGTRVRGVNNHIPRGTGAVNRARKKHDFFRKKNVLKNRQKIHSWRGSTRLLIKQNARSAFCFDLFQFRF